MKRSNLVIIALVIMALPAMVAADTFVTQAVHQDAMTVMGQTTPATDDTTTMWVGDGVARMDNAEGAFIIDGKKNMMYIVSDEDESYVEMPMDALGDMGKMMGLEEGSEEAAMMKQQMQAMMSMMQTSLKITPTEETKEIRGWNCKKYIMDMKVGMAEVKSETWVTKDVELDWTMFKHVSNAMMMQLPGAQEVMKEMEKMDGFPVLTNGTASVMGASVKSTNEVLSVEVKDAPKGTYTVPTTYTKEKWEMKMGR